MSVEHTIRSLQLIPLQVVPDLAAAAEPGAGEGLSPREVLALYCRQTDELARIVEAALAEEDERHLVALAALEEGHRRRTVVLAMVADALGEKNAQLDEVAHDLGATATGGAR